MQGDFRKITAALKSHGADIENILREDERFRIMTSIAQELHLEYGDMNEWAGDVLAEISRVKAEQIPLDHYYASSVPEEEFRKVCRMYTERQAKLGRIDFDDMCVYTYDLFHARTDILKAWQDHFRYILIDEFQDINMLQYRIIRMLAAPRNNLFIVGDDDQSIYRFRGSRPEIMLNFPKDYPGTAVMKLNENYRSTPQIVAASAHVIAQNRTRYHKDLYSRKVKEFDDALEERERAFAREDALKRRNLEEELEENRQDSQRYVGNTVKNFSESFSFYLNQIKQLMNALGDVAVQTGKNLFTDNIAESNLKGLIGQQMADKLQSENGDLMDDEDGRILFGNYKSLDPEEEKAESGSEPAPEE